MASYTNTFTVTGPTVYVRWMASGSSKARFYLDDVTITSSTSGGDVPASNDIQEFTVSGTSYSFTDLTPETTYYARVKGDAGWSNVEEFTTESAGNTAPVLTVPETSYSITVGDPDVDFTVTATGTPAPTVTASCTEGAYFIFENNEFLFEPDTAGTYHFVFTATNSEGSDSKTVTVTVSAAPVTVPTLTVTNVNATTADASWTACDGVSTYTLQLASDDQFTTGGSGAGETLTETFANITFSPGGSGYTDQTISGGDLGTWTATSSRGDQGSPVIRYAGTLTSPTIANGVAAVEFDYDWPYSESGSCDIELYVGGTSVGSATVSANSSGTATYTLDSPVAGPTTIEFLNKASSNKRIRVNEVRITTPSSGSSGGSLIAEYTVSGTSYGFTGLSPETTYYARVKGDDDWSNVEEFTTVPVGNSAPVWSSLPAQTVNVGEPLEFDLAPYVTGSPVPVILLGDTEFVAEMQGSTFVFDPSSSGDYTFSFTASNAVGTADATLSVTAVSEAPELTISSSDTSFSVTVGDTVEFSVTATGIPAPAVSVSTMATVSYSFENGAFRFEANDPGLYEFEFSAENVVGTDTLTVTVEVLATVPTLSVSNVTATTAFASWNNCANVLEYTLQLSTNEYFETTGGAGNFTEEFSSPGFTASTRYSTDSQTVDGRTWSYENAMVKPGASGAGIGSAGFVQLRADDGILTLPVLDSPSAISVIARASAATDGTLMLQQKVNGSWEDLLNENWSLTDIPAEYTYAFTDAGSGTELRLRAVGRAVYIYDVSVTGAASTTDGTGTFLVLEGSGTSSYTFTDLLPDTTYWARVKGNSDWSEPVSFHTLATPANLVEALGLPMYVTDDQIVCRITAFSYADATGAEGTFAVTAEDEGILLAESSTMSTNVQFSVLGAATLGNFAPLDATECGVELTSRTAPYGFRVSHPGTNLFFRVQLETGNN